MQNEHDQSRSHDRVLDQNVDNRRKPDQGRYEQSESNDSPQNTQQSSMFEASIIGIPSEAKKKSSILGVPVVQSESEQSQSEKNEPNQNEPDQDEPENSLEALQKQPLLENPTDSTIHRAKSEATPSEGCDVQSEPEDTPEKTQKSPIFEAATTSNMIKSESNMLPLCDGIGSGPAPINTQINTHEHADSKNTTNDQESQKESSVLGNISPVLNSLTTCTVPRTKSDTSQPSGDFEDLDISTNTQDQVSCATATIDNTKGQELEEELMFPKKILLSDYFEVQKSPQTISSGSKKKRSRKKKKNSNTTNQAQPHLETRVPSSSNSDISTHTVKGGSIASRIPTSFGTPDQNCKKCNAFLLVHSKKELELRECDLCRDHRDTGCALCKEDFRKLDNKGVSLKDIEKSADVHRMFIEQCMAWSRQQKKTLEEWDAK